MITVGLVIFLIDQITKRMVLFALGFGQEWVLLEGFFKLVHWGNTGAAWNLFYGNNRILAIIALAALTALFLSRHHFDIHRVTGQVALGLISGGILGNLTDRLVVNHVIDFLYFYMIRKNGEELGFPAFNVADAAICSGVALIFYQSFNGKETLSSAVKK
ncbi:MAG TPA: signal peptidase II [Candidatus Paceibacterota bacterium]|nr:signal peptidase II [Verrucomicrobiota bacterium]HRY51632.1 signal peptidase II [Candidatus Paceibacterota bacterium]